MNSFGDRLKYLRAGASQAELSTLLEIKQTTLSNYERNRNEPNHDTLKKLCSHFGVCVEWLLFGEGPIYFGKALQEQQQTPEQPVLSPKTAEPCPQCAEMKVELAEERRERRELSAELRKVNAENRHLLKENGDLRERCATLEERQKFCCPEEPHQTTQATPFNDNGLRP